MIQFAQLGNVGWKDALIMQLLNCGYNDIDALRDVNYDIGEIVDELVADGIRPTIDNILMDVFGQAATDFMTSVRECLETFYYYEDDDYLEDERVLEKMLNEILENEDKYIHADVSGLYVKDIDDLREFWFAEELERIEHLMGESIKDKNW